MLERGVVAQGMEEEEGFGGSDGTWNFKLEK